MNSPLLSTPDSLPRLYNEFASWWTLLSAPEDYAEEAKIYRSLILSFSSLKPATLLELGCGGGNNASHLKEYFRLTLTDLSQEMLSVSRQLNPECKHIQGDMRSIRLERLFDVVFIHDAIMYLTSERDLRCAIETAHIHCRAGGVVLFAPDHVKETFCSSAKHGGHDGDNRGLRYLEWTWDPDPDDSTYVVDFVYLLRNGVTIRREYDRHTFGLFPRQDWIRWISEPGFNVHVIPFDHSEIEPGSCEIFMATKS